MLEYLMSLFKALRMLLYAASLYMGVVNIVYIFYLIKGKRQGKSLKEYVGRFFSKKKGVIICEIITVLGLISSPLVFPRFQNTDIGSFLEKESYRESYYVYIREDADKAKAYKVKADIFKGDYGYSTYGDEGEEEFVVQGNGYFVEKVYWDNGGYLTFLEEDDWSYSSSRSRIYPGIETRVTDHHDKDYYITLTSEKAREIN